MATHESLALLQKMLSDEPGGRESVAQALEAHEDPRVRLIAQYMNRRPVIETADAEEAAPQDSRTPTSLADPAHTDRSRRVRRKLRQLIEDLERAHTVGDTLAAALGACYLCWGEEATCPVCSGAGSPGWSVPDRDLFIQFVAPAVHRIDKPGRNDAQEA